MIKTSSRLLAGAALAIVPLLGLAGVASADTQSVNYSCQGKAAGQTTNTSLSQNVDSTAPATVAPGGALTITLAPEVNTVPTQAGSFSVKSVKNLTLAVPIPANATLVSFSLSGGSGIGSASVAQVGNNIVTSVTGPINGGAQFQLPALTLNLTAGDSGTITTTLAGTSFTDAGLKFTTTVSVFGFPIDAPTSCFPSPAPTLTSTTIGS
ncbi:cyclase [Kutzneria buriramensis]|uniref:Dehydratase n=1 Tax=Kutzneria buriramensis TaxID=1045776 RepID=A0A3E0HD14_9PSEU|nr:cyclase [Kutzneria buriramensis]REH42629.1 dehydratase [Kutzneria buriramensis]